MAISEEFRQLTGADGDVVAVLLQVDLAVVQVDLHVDFGKRADELAQRRRHITPPEADRRRDLEPAFRLAHLVVDAGTRGLDLGEDALDMAEERRALLGDTDRARRAVEEARGELVLQRLDAFRDGARRQAELGAHRGQILHRRDAGKNAHILDVHE